MLFHLLESKLRAVFCLSTVLECLSDVLKEQDMGFMVLQY